MKGKEMKDKKSSNRWKNVFTYIGIIGVILTAINVNATTLTSWGALGQAFLNVVQNPYLLGSVVMALLGTYVDPTTGGLKD